MTITKREILFSVIIILVFIFLGIFIADGIEQGHLAEAEKYYKALKVEDAKMFDYNKKTNGGNTLAYGNANFIDTVSFPEIIGEYGVIVKHEERYTKHIDYVTKEDEDGNTYTEEVITYSWDSHGSESLRGKKVNFLEQEFDSSIFDLGSGSRLDLSKHIQEKYKERIHFNYLYEDSSFWENVGDLRWSYSFVPVNFEGTLFLTFDNTDITSKNTAFYYGQTINQVIEAKEDAATTSKIIFWVLWILFTGFVVWAFYYIDNHWLEDHH